MKTSEIAFGLLRIPIDFVMAMISFFIAYKIRLKTDLIPGIQLPLTVETFPSFENYLTISIIGTFILMGIFGLYNLYSLKITSGFGKELRQIFTASAIWLMVVITYYFIIRDFPFSRLVLAYTWLSIILFISVGRVLIRIVQGILLTYNIGTRKIAIIGYNTVAKYLLKSLGKDKRYRIACVIDEDNEKIGTIKELDEVVRKYTIEEIIQTKTDLPGIKQDEILNFCRQNHLQYHFVPDLIDMHHTNIDLHTITGIPLITLKPTPLDGWGRVMKRLVDMAGSLAGLIILSPILCTIAIFIKLDSKGPVLFSRLEDDSPTLRMGQHRKKFHFLKFRTMINNTHQQRYTTLAEKNLRKESPLVKIKNDPRITKIGKFLRQTGLDELPQLWNVLKGEMSLVGPRPHLPEEVNTYKNHHKFVLSIKPGITGLAQISGRSDLDFEKEIQLDTYYIENWSLLLDAKILLKTLKIPFKTYRE